MPPRTGSDDLFERHYTERFRNLAHRHGHFIHYEQDRAATDIGVHLFLWEQNATRRMSPEPLSQTRVWFQLKGRTSQSLSFEKYRQAKYVSVKLRVDDLKFWYASPEAFYLAVYIECAEHFIVEDIRDIVERHWNKDILHPATLGNQRTVTVRLQKNAVLTDIVFTNLRRHQSIRIDGPTYRGMPLGHRLDPLRCIPRKMEVPIFTKLVGRLLEEHRFQIRERVEITNPSLNIVAPDDISLTTGVMHDTFEWSPQLFTQFGMNPGDLFRREGQPEYVQGPCAVLIHSNPTQLLSGDNFESLRDYLHAQDAPRLLVFVNDQHDHYFGSYFAPFRQTDIQCMPHLLGDLAYNILTAPIVYLEFREHIQWDTVSFLHPTIQPPKPD